MSLRFSALLLGVLLLCAHARAQDDAAAQARAFFEVGAQAYEQGDYAAALEAFHEAYARVQRPGLLFSMAQAHRRAFFATNDASHLTRAVEHYRKYLQSGDGARRKDAEEALAQLVPLVGAESESSEPPPVSTPSGKLMIASSTPGAVLTVDGVRAPRLPHVVTVVPGEHTLVLSAPGHREETRTLPVPEGAAFALDIALRELPGFLSVTGSQGGLVWLDGRLIGALPLPPLPLSPGGHQVSLQKPGRRVETRRVQLARGGAASLHLDLEPTRQRIASQALLWGGGVLLVGSGATLGAALVRQADAENLLETREQRALTAAERDHYDELVRTRDRLRASAIGLGAVGAACLLVGGALVALDRPEVPGLLEEPGAARPEHKPAPSEIIAGPIWDGDRVGVALHGRF